MRIVSEISDELGDDWLPEIYRNKIRTQRTRAIKLDIPNRENPADVLHTLLGIELKVRKSRFSCPDLATARYMRVFARLGCSNFAIPYDITQISGAADLLETSWKRTILILKRLSKDDEGLDKGKARTALIKAMRDKLREIGPGEAMPTFNTPTRRR